MLPRLDIFNYYNYYHTTGAKRDLTKSEKVFFDFCMENHTEICNEDTPKEILTQATTLYMDIE